MHRDNFISHKNFIIATTFHHYHTFHITYRYTKQISHKIRDPFGTHQPSLFLFMYRLYSHLYKQRYHLPIHCATPLLMKRQSAFQNYILCLNTELIQPHQKRSSDQQGVTKFQKICILVSPIPSRQS